MSKFDIATEMNGIMASPAKAKAKAEAEKEKAAKVKAKEKADAEKAKEKAKAEKEKAKAKADKEKAKAKKKAMTKYEACVYSLCAASEILDEAGLGKASALTILALDNLVKTAAKKKEEKEKGKGKKETKEEKEAAKKKEEEKKKKEDKADAKGLPPWLKKTKDGKKDGKKEEKDDKKKVKKASEGCEGCDVDADDNKDFEDILAELNEPEGDDDWEVLSEPATDTQVPFEDLEVDPSDEDIEGSVGALDPDDGDNTSLFEELDEENPEGELKSAGQKSSLQKLAEQLGKSFLA